MSLIDFSQMTLLAQGGEEAAAATFLIIILAVVFLFVAAILGVAIFIIYLLYRALAAIPEPYRAMEPGLVWLLLIPCFGIFWNFMVFQKIPESYRNYFGAMGRHEHGDCGQQLGLVFCILACLLIIPYMNSLIAIGALVVLIVFLVKIYELKRVVDSTGYYPTHDSHPASGYGRISDPKNPYAGPGAYGQYPPK